ncbi:MAG: hypothetical protein KDD22_03750, partial [Bdellovibrionales bacterium]|nr:hypothetical protein [Bdellovibrionales bacterium]
NKFAIGTVDRLKGFDVGGARRLELASFAQGAVVGKFEVDGENVGAAVFVQAGDFVGLSGEIRKKTYERGCKNKLPIHTK